MLIEGAHLAPRHSPELRALYDRRKERRHAGAAAVAVARKLVADLLAVDKSGQPFQVRPTADALSSPPGKDAFPPEPPIDAVPVARRSSPSRVRSAAAGAPAKTKPATTLPAAPWTAPVRRAGKASATGGSNGKAGRRPD